MKNSEQIVIDQNVADAIDHHVAQSTSHLNTIPRYFLFISCVIAISVIVFAYLIFQKQSHLETELAEKIHTEIRTTNASKQLPSEAQQYVRNQLEFLEKRQTAVLDETKSSLERMSYLFTSVGAFFGLVMIYFGYRQVSAEARAEESSRQYDQEMRNLVKSFQENITTISSLIGTLEQSYAYRKDIEIQLHEINSRAIVLEESRRASTEKIKSQVDFINKQALSIFREGIDRKKLTTEQMRDKLDTFRIQLDNLEGTNAVGSELNPFCIFIRGLSHMSRYRYKLAIQDLQSSIEIANSHQVIQNDPKFPSVQFEDVHKILKEAIIQSNYFNAMAFRNLGDFENSIQAYGKCIDNNINHFEAKVERLQVMYFNGATTFSNLAKLYDRLQHEMDDYAVKNPYNLSAFYIDARKFLFLNRGDLYLPKEFHTEGRSHYRGDEDKKLALEAYRLATRESKSSLTLFSLAQALECSGYSDWSNNTPDELYKEALSEASRRLVVNNDPHFAVSLHFLQGVAAKKLKQDSKPFEAALNSRLQELPSDILFWSPITKVMVSKPELLDELQKFDMI